MGHRDTLLFDRIGIKQSFHSIKVKFCKNRTRVYTGDTLGMQLHFPFLADRSQWGKKGTQNRKKKKKKSSFWKRKSLLGKFPSTSFALAKMQKPNGKKRITCSLKNNIVGLS